jgi:hypothetical protein
MQSLTKLLSQFSAAFYSDNFSELISLGSSISSFCEMDEELRALCDSSKEFSKFKEDSLCFEQCLHLLHNSGWDLVSNYNDILVESHFSGADFCTRASVLINASIFETLSVINEEDLLPSW